MKKIGSILLRAFTKYFPILSNIYLILSMILDYHKINIDNYVFDISGGSLYMGLICLAASLKYEFGSWHIILCICITLSYILEWVDINFMQIPYYVQVVQYLFIFSTINSAIFFYDGKSKKDNKVDK